MVYSESLGRAWNKTTQFLACYFPTSPTFQQLSPLQNLRGEWPHGSLRSRSQSSFWDGRRGLGDHSELTSYLQLCSVHAGDGSWPGGETADSLRKLQKQNIDDILAETRWKAIAFSKLACETGREVVRGRRSEASFKSHSSNHTAALASQDVKGSNLTPDTDMWQGHQVLGFELIGLVFEFSAQIGGGGGILNIWKFAFFPNKGFYINVYACNMHVTLDCGSKSEKQFI